MMRSITLAGTALLTGMLGYFLPVVGPAEQGSRPSDPVHHPTTSPETAAARGTPTLANQPVRYGRTRSLEKTFDVDVEADASATKQAGAALGTLVTLENRKESKARALYAIELVDDVGDYYVHPQVSALQELDAKGGKANKLHTRFDVPPGLPDGYYMLRVHAAFAPEDGGEVEQLGALYVKVDAGVIQVTDVNDYLLNSRARFLVQL